MVVVLVGLLAHTRGITLQERTIAIQRRWT